MKRAPTPYLILKPIMIRLGIQPETREVRKDAAIGYDLGHLLPVPSLWRSVWRESLIVLPDARKGPKRTRIQVLRQIRLRCCHSNRWPATNPMTISELASLMH